MPCDLLVLAPHPDDAEIHFGASMARCVRAGGRVVLIDATAGEMGSRGDAAGRAREAAAAADALGLAARENLGLPDGRLSAADPDARLALVTAIRRWQPRLIAAPHAHVSHPDHAACTQLAIDARKAAELHRLPGCALPAWRGARLIAYEMELPIRPDALVACSESDRERKLAALACHASQFGRDGIDGPRTTVASTAFQDWIDQRGRSWGFQAGAAYAEAIRAPTEPLALADPLSLAAGSSGSS